MDTVKLHWSIRNGRAKGVTLVAQFKIRHEVGHVRSMLASVPSTG